MTAPDPDRSSVPAGTNETPSDAEPNGVEPTDAPPIELSSEDELPAGAVRVTRGAEPGVKERRRRNTERNVNDTARTRARRRALDVLFEADAKGLMRSGDRLLAVLAERQTTTAAQDGLPPYAVELVEGVADHLTIIDEILDANSRSWSVARMPAVDRNLLRLGVFEVVFLDDVEDYAAIDQAAYLARELSTDDSPAYLNAVLAEVARTKDTYRL